MKKKQGHWVSSIGIGISMRRNKVAVSRFSLTCICLYGIVNKDFFYPSHLLPTIVLAAPVPLEFFDVHLLRLSSVLGYFSNDF